MGMHDIRVCVMDLRPNARQARKLAMQYPGRLYCCEFVRTTKDVYIDPNEDYLLKGSRSDILDAVAQDIRSGRIQLYPMDANVEKWISHWEHLQRTEDQDSLGRSVIKWMSTGDDHFALATAYCHLAVKLAFGDTDDFASSTTADLADALCETEGFMYEEW